MKRILVFAVSVVASLSLLSPPAWAARTRFHELAESPIYKEKMGGMIGRGLLNIVTSPVDILVNTVNETKAGPPFISTLVGLAKGVGCGVLRAGSGAVDIVTFWVPGFNGFPVSDSYENCLGVSGAAASVSVPSAASSPIPWESQPLTEPEPVQAAAEPVAPAKEVWKK